MAKFAYHAFFKHGESNNYLTECETKTCLINDIFYKTRKDTILFIVEINHEYLARLCLPKYTILTCSMVI